jgi:hypothetical protein
MIGYIKKYLSRRLGRLRKRRAPLSEPPEIGDKRFLFIGGLHRSGTSVLHRMLREHPSVSGFHDTGVPEDEGQHLQSVIPAAYRYGGPGEFALHPDAHLTQDSALINPENRNRLLSEWGAYYDLQKPVLLEKSPPNLIRSRFLRQLFPGARFLFIVRHPVAVSLATEKWSDKTMGERLLHWHAAYSIMLDDIDSAEDCLVIRYEDFVRSPQHYLEQICDLLGVARFSARQIVEDHNAKYFLEWRERYAADMSDLQAVLPAGNPVLQRFGYSLGEPYVSEI